MLYILLGEREAEARLRNFWIEHSLDGFTVIGAYFHDILNIFVFFIFMQSCKINESILIHGSESVV